jgi:hypothetical protein
MAPLSIAFDSLVEAEKPSGSECEGHEKTTTDTIGFIYTSQMNVERRRRLPNGPGAQCRLHGKPARGRLLTEAITRTLPSMVAREIADGKTQTPPGRGSGK